MTLYRRHTLYSLIFLALGITATAQDLDSFGISLQADEQRTFMAGNQAGAFWHGETHRQNRNPEFGYSIGSQRYFNDYEISTAGMVLQREKALSTTLYPNRLVRRFASVEETFYFIDSLHALLFRFEAKKAQSLTFRPIFDAIFNSTNWQGDPGEAVSQSKVSTSPGYPEFALAAAWGNSGEAKFVYKTEPGPRVDGKRTELQHLEEIQFNNVSEAFVLILFQSDSTTLLRTGADIRNNPRRYISPRVKRLAQLLPRASMSSGNTEVDAAYVWAMISASDLVWNTFHTGSTSEVFSESFSSREALLSFSGSFLCSGRFSEARELLHQLGAAQNGDIVSGTYGRIPANPGPGEPSRYDGADITPLFVISCEKLLQYTGDFSVIEEMFPVIKRAMDGTIKYDLDEYGFLTHSDGETWMNAATYDGPTSPRGNRAIEIQTLWMEQIRIAENWALQLGYDDWAEDWQLLLNRVRAHFFNHFWSEEDERFYDHLLPGNNGSPEVRSNALISAGLSAANIFTPAQSQLVLREAASELLYPWGIGTLAEKEENFHPYYIYPPYYSRQESIHNGPLSNWTNGPLISLLAGQHPELAWQLMTASTRQIMRSKAAGTLMELTEAWPRPGKSWPETAGDVSSLSGLSEFLRNWREDILGIRADLHSNRLHISPAPVAALEKIEFRAEYGNMVLAGERKIAGDTQTFSLEPARLPRSVDLHFTFHSGSTSTDCTLPWSGESALTVEFSSASAKPELRVNGVRWPKIKTSATPLPDQLSFHQPDLSLTPPSMLSPDYQRISAEDATRSPGFLTPMLYDIRSRKGDDIGPQANGYTYPLNTVFEPGIFDARRVRIKNNNEYYFFEIEMDRLVNPGETAEAGFQYTFLAISLQFEKLKGIRRTKVDYNANYSVPVEYAYDFIIYVGNGYRIIDGKGDVVAEYQPGSDDKPIGSAKEGKIRFAVPIQYLSEKLLRNAVVLTGGQDDNGSGGLGEFREVRRLASEWYGSGGQKPTGNPNIYDVVLIRR